MTDRMSSNLLEAICVNAGLDYLSDLHMPQYQSQVCLAVGEIPEEWYSAGEWAAAAAYILGDQPGAETAGEIKATLLARLG